MGDRHMRFLPPEIEIADDEGFNPEKDIFGRKAFGSQFRGIIQSLEGPAVFLLDSPWGTGKTTFLKMWQGELLLSGIPSIYFDSFANDYHEDAFLTLAGQIISRANALLPRDKKAVADFTDKAVRVGKALGRAALRIGVHAATAGLISSATLGEGETALSEAVKAAGDESSKIVDDILKDILESHAKDKAIFTEFSSALEGLASTLAARAKSEGNNAESKSQNKPLVIIIDELDRCRPSFSLSLIEKIKHFFSVPGIVFVLVASLEQLEAAVKFSYGDINARSYLEKFYHMRVLLPGNQPTRSDRAAITYLNHLFPNTARTDTEWQYMNSMKEIIYQFDSVTPLSLRTLERICVYVNISLATLSNTWATLSEVTAILCIMKVINPALYQRTRSGMAMFAEIESFSKFSLWRNRTNYNEISSESNKCENTWRYILGEQHNQQELNATAARIGSPNPRSIILEISNILDGFLFPS